MIEQRIEGLHRTREATESEAITPPDFSRRSEPSPTPAETTTTVVPERSERISLFPESDLGDARRRWQEIQGSFVDDPRTAVRNADELVASLMNRLAQVFGDERGKLEREWDQSDNVSTESLRLALQRYRSFFDRLLSV